MISDKLRDGIVNLVREELAMANKKYPLFTSNHEGYAVIKEELEECQEVLNKAAAEFAEMWKSIRKDSRCGGTSIAGKLFFIAVAAEAIQAAVYREKVSKDDDERIYNFSRAGMDMNDFLRVKNNLYISASRSLPTAQKREMFVEWVLENGYTSKQRSVIYEEFNIAKKYRI